MRTATLLLAIGMVGLGCQAAPVAPTVAPPPVAEAVQVGRVAEALAEGTAGASEVRLIPFATGLGTANILEVGGTVPTHYHAAHDETVVILEGQGRIAWKAGGLWQMANAGPGTVLFIPHGTVHTFRSDGNYPVRAVNVFAPAFDGGDRVLVDEAPDWGGTETP